MLGENLHRTNSPKHNTSIYVELLSSIYSLNKDRTMEATISNKTLNFSISTESSDYKLWAKEISSQASNLISSEISESEKEYIISKIKSNAMKAGKALSDSSFTFGMEQKHLLIELISEWTLNKSITLVNSGLSCDYWDKILQRIAYTIFEAAKYCFAEAISREDTLTVIEHHANKAYKDGLDELLKRKVITDECYEKAMM